MRGLVRRVALVAALFLAIPVTPGVATPPLPLCGPGKVGVMVPAGVKELIAPRTVHAHQAPERRKIVTLDWPRRITVWLHTPGFKVAAGTFGMELYVPQPGYGVCVTDGGSIEISFSTDSAARTSGSPVPYIEITVWPPAQIGPCYSNEVLHVPDVPLDEIETSGSAGVCRFRIVVTPG